MRAKDRVNRAIEFEPDGPKLDWLLRLPAKQRSEIQEIVKLYHQGKAKIVNNDQNISRVICELYPEINVQPPQVAKWVKLTRPAGAKG